MLTRDDVDLLLEAVEAWEDSQSRDALMIDMLSIGMSRSKEEAANVLKEREVAKREQAQEVRMRKERAILLKAELLRLRDRIEAGEFIESLGT